VQCHIFIFINWHTQARLTVSALVTYACHRPCGVPSNSQGSARLSRTFRTVPPHTNIFRSRPSPPISADSPPGTLASSKTLVDTGFSDPERTISDSFDTSAHVIVS